MAQPLAAPPESDEIPDGTEAVLIVEDEPAVRKLAGRVLRERGYTVLEAEDGNAALRFLERGDPIDLLLSDAILPGGGGRELAELIRERAPGLPVLFMSGHATPALTRRGILRSDVELLEKPFTAASLARKVRAVLDHAP